jgi:hypothetical protein
MARISFSTILRTTLTIALLLVATEAARAQNQTQDDAPLVTRGSLEEIRDKRKARLIVISSDVLDVREPESGLARAVRNYKPETGRQRRVYTEIARRLNGYIRKYGSMIGVTDPASADYIVVFNLLRYRRILYSVYASGEMYIVLDRPNEPIRILWKTEKEMLSDDATTKLLNALKTFRREK